MKYNFRVYFNIFVLELGVKKKYIFVLEFIYFYI